MKICWWTVYPTVNQTAILAALRARGIDVVVCYFSQYDLYRRLLGWKDRPLEPWEHFAPTIAAARAAIPDWDARIQMVSSFADGISWRVMLWCRWHRNPWFVVTEGSRGRWFARPALCLFARWLDRHALMGFFHGRAAAEQFGRLGVRAAKRAVCTYPLPDVPAGLPPRAPDLTFVYAGVLMELKAVDVIAEAFRRVRAEFPSVRLVVLGDGDLKHVFDGIDGVERVGAVPPEEVCTYLARGHVILQPSRQDGWGLALLEGAACGLAMIGSDHTPSAVERIVDGVNGFLVPAGDVEALAAAMRRYASDPALAVRHGAAARESVRDMSADAQAALVASGLERRRRRVVADFWEEHCTECGEPACYRTCAKFSRAPNGRCRRFEGGIRPAPDAGPNAFAVKFLPWGKLELLFHGRMASVQACEDVRRWEARRMPFVRFLGRLTPSFVPPARNPYGLFRSWRWRKAVKMSACEGCPSRWDIHCTSDRAAAYVCEIRHADGALAFARRLALVAGENVFSFAVPPVSAGALFRIFPASDADAGAELVFRELSLWSPPPEDAPHAPFVKCLAWDLDGTLWKGVLAEDGVEGLVLRDEAIALVRALDARGIVNSICSKNDPAPVQEALARFGIADLFVFPQVGWGAKSASLRQLARDLNVGLDALALVDDASWERAEVHQNAPAVRTFDVADIGTLAAESCFNPPASAESASRRMRYQEEAARRGAEAGSGVDHVAFLKMSHIRLILGPVEGETAVRCRELVQRSNQLTLAARRYDEAAFANLLTSASCSAVQCTDDYGDYGTVGFAAVARVDDGTAELREFVMSCRVAKKLCEQSVILFLAERAAAQGATRFRAVIVPTGRNGALVEAFDAMPFTVHTADGQRVYELDLSNPASWRDAVRHPVEARA